MANKYKNLDGNDRDVESLNADFSHSGGGFYEIHVKGQLDSRWSDRLENMEVKLLENGEMILLGSIVDQAALMGVLNKLSNLNMILISVNQSKRKE